MSHAERRVLGWLVLVSIALGCASEGADSSPAKVGGGTGSAGGPAAGGGTAVETTGGSSAILLPDAGVGTGAAGSGAVEECAAESVVAQAGPVKTSTSPTERASARSSAWSTTQRDVRSPRAAARRGTGTTTILPHPRRWSCVRRPALG